jgi:hypothetical protein
LNKDIVCNIITRPFTPPQTQNDDPNRLKTPLTTKSICHFQISYRCSPNPEKLQLLFKANEILATQHSINEHTKRGLVKTIKDEKKKRRRGKKLNALGVEDHGPQFFSPTTIKRAQDVQAAKAAEAEVDMLFISIDQVVVEILRF